ncbi:hypothetical protein ASD15_13760 [Massilia sp. Root351]|jgi:hypothetical protein|uniref:hypothetical protein n=1 Tax=Massilia sp. Root351 TaxID=1736522 RepID=UPI00070FB4BB|nr:hypothetical protein [Massilia sp. Root351]KQV80949.1 hypothetical protein ASD15_13760 [Massilia sp. Root351]
MIDKQAMMRPTPGLAITFGWMLILLMALPAIWFGASRIWAKVAAEEWSLVRATVLSSKAYHRTGKSND